MVRKLDVILPLISAIIIGGISLLQRDSLNIMTIKLIVVITVFYIFGLMISTVLQRIYSSSKSNYNNTQTMEEPMKESNEDRNDTIQ